MKISLWMLADQLGAYAPRCQIHEGKRVLQNARILSDGSRMSRYTVYLSQLTGNQVALLNGVDIIYMACDDIHQLLDEVLDIFERYNEWRNGISEMMRRPCTVAEILQEFCRIRKQYYILADASYYVLEQFGEEEYLQRNRKAQKVLQDRIMSVEILKKINQNPHVRLAEQPSYLVGIPELDNVSAITNLFVDHTHQGWLIANNPANHFTQGDLDLQDEMGNILDQWLGANRDYEKNMHQAGIFLDIMENEFSSTELVFHRLEGFSWYREDRKTVYAILRDSNHPEQTRVLDRFLQGAFPYTFVFRFQNDLYLLANWALSAEEATERELGQILYRHNCRAGKSPYFQDIFRLKEYVDLAKMAAEYGRKGTRTICRMEDSQLQYIFHLLGQLSAVSISHPALEELRDYDRQHHSEYLSSLYLFLLEERNCQRAAERLHIHRSTLLYRISKITELTGLDLDDPDVRLHLLLSFGIDRGCSG